MEFNEKLQELRKKKGLTQEELAKEIYVSRTAVSKWESGRGVPNIESLKALSAFFSVSIDDLLSGEELLTIADEDVKRSQEKNRDILFGILDCSMLLLLVLPFFGMKYGKDVVPVSLLSLSSSPGLLKTVFFVIVSVSAAFGAAELLLQNCRASFWSLYSCLISVCISIAAVLCFIVCRQTYAALFSFLFLAIKAVMLLKRQ